MYKWSTLHASALAKEIRELYPVYETANIIDEPTRIMSTKVVLEQRAILTVLALNLARRFKEDNERFDPLKFLNACSPDVELYPLAELWEEDDE